ncbi:DUF3047 domain-containing protein [Falsiroseomonas selenitidurans]|uniref:DUF3047 domain-containing protein n=1 Tax=Falsiroseomonas selenitidurans TaxID=2716335 RepID=A0ABX1E7G2_9PROT|nr:DUF3047 domain-containing protein [Falsiroseomonas selenitidurans]NKC33140.1 DUF3047 domain-containing protein [Falsiroseomonas selenitidurans]
MPEPSAMRPDPPPARRRPALRILLLLALAPLLAAAIAPGRTAPELERLGWRKVLWQGIAPPAFTATPGDGVRVQGRGQAAFLYRPVQGQATCLAWRWRVDAGPPATDLARRGGDDRALAVAVGFTGFGPAAGFAARAQHGLAQAAAGDHVLPRSVLSYVWGGEARPGFQPSPWAPAISRLRVLRPAGTPRGVWQEERVDLAADWRRAFGDAPVPPLREVAIATDTEDTGAAVDARVEAIRLEPC